MVMFAGEERTYVLHLAVVADVLDDAVARAREIIDAHRNVRLPDDAYTRFLDALDAPPEPNAALVELAERARRFRRTS